MEGLSALPEIPELRRNCRFKAPAAGQGTPGFSLSEKY
jgi:hypothetical protein